MSYVSQKSIVSKSVLGLLALAPFTETHAQQAPPVGTELPTIVVPAPAVQGATLDKRRTEPAPQSSPQPVSSTSSAPTPKSAPAAAPTVAPAAAVSASDGGTGSADGGVPQRELGTSVTVVSREDLSRQQVRHAADALRSLPGVSVNRPSGPGSLTQIRMRGAEGNHTLVLIDGVTANDSGNGEVDFSLIPVEDIERVEVIRGALSGLYGSNAIGGVINIITRKGSGPLSASIRTEVGSFGTRDVAARLGGGTERGYVSLSGQWKASEGFNVSPSGDEKDGMRLGSFAARAGGKITNDLSLDAHLRRTDRRVQNDGFGGPVVGSVGTAYDDASWQKNTLLLGGMTLKLAPAASAFSNELFYTFVSNDQRAFDGTYISNSHNLGITDVYGYRGSVRLDTPTIMARHTFSVEASQQNERFTPSGDYDDGIERKRTRTSFAGEWRGGFADTLFLTAGVRRDDNDTFRDFTTWRFAASLAPAGSALRPHASVGTGVKLPTMFEQFGSNLAYFAPNPNLKPEESLSWDAGVEVKLLGGRALFDITYFRANLTNEIRTDYSGFPYTPINLTGESRRQGVEVSLKGAVTSWLTAGISYTYTDARDPSDVVEIRRAPHTARIDATAAFADGKGTVTAAAVYNGAMTDFRFTNVSDGFGGTFPSLSGRAGLAPYWLLTLGTSYKVQPNLELYGRIENALDTKYQEQYGYNTARIAGYAGVKITFDDLLGVKK